jgi:hypothetical protein
MGGGPSEMEEGEGNVIADFAMNHKSTMWSCDILRVGSNDFVINFEVIWAHITWCMQPTTMTRTRTHWQPQPHSMTTMTMRDGNRNRDEGAWDASAYEPQLALVVCLFFYFSCQYPHQLKHWHHQHNSNTLHRQWNHAISWPGADGDDDEVWGSGTKILA